VAVILPVAVLSSKFSEISKKLLDIMAANTDGNATDLVKSVRI
jgi:hypothetical protein